MRVCIRARKTAIFAVLPSIALSTEEARMNRPDIIVARRDLGRLDALLGEVETRFGEVGAFLLDEITRARIVHDREIPPTLVTMGATVHFRNEDSGHECVVRLVYPHETRSCDRSVSVLTPVGAALLGLSEGQSIGYETLDGRLKTLRVLKVVGSAPDDAAPSVAAVDAGSHAPLPEPRRLWFT
jgi:regulator of nucleoside diphosphate kinase